MPPAVVNESHFKSTQFLRKRSHMTNLGTKSVLTP